MDNDLDPSPELRAEKRVSRLTAGKRATTTMIMVILVAVVINHFYNPNEPVLDIGGALNGTSGNASNVNVVPPAAGSNSGTNTNTNVGTSGITGTASLAQSISATKTGNAVTATITRTGAPAFVFTYKEPFEKNNSGNTWSMLPPSISLSPNKKLVAYCDTTGLIIMNVSTGLKANIRAHRQGSIINGEEEAISPNSPAYSVDRCVLPIWSPDNRYILYTQVPYESRAYGIADLQANTYKDSVLSGSVDDMKWVTANNKLYLEYTSTPEVSGDVYNAPYGTYRAEVSSINGIVFLKI